MSTITLRSVKGSPLTNAEVDANFSNLNTDKYQEGSDIGGTTPAAGTFTTLVSTGNITYFGGAIGSDVFRVYKNNTVSGGTSTETSPAFSFIPKQNNFGASIVGLGENPRINTVGSDGFYFTTVSSLGYAGLTQLKVTHTASAVNYVQVTGAATGNSVVMSAQGSDANVGLNIVSKGNFGISFRTRGSGTERNGLIIVDNGASSVNYLQIQSNLTGTAPSLSSQGSDTNIPLVLQPKGTGALQAQQTDSTATGGNARGANAVDWQTSRSTAAQVANGSFAFIGAGTRNTSSGTYAGTVAGYTNIASGFSSFVGAGNNNSASNTYSSITTGVNNTANGLWSTVVNGNGNTASGYLNFIGNGYGNSCTSGSAVTTQSATMNGTTAVTLSGSNASIKVGQLITGTSISDNTYVAAISGTSLTLSQAASGSSTSTLSCYTPHGVVVGGGNNQATGSYSFIGGGGDAGTAGNRNVASGDWSFIGSGRNNTASGAGSFIGGGGYYNGITGTAPNSAVGDGSVIVGGGSNNAGSFAAAVLGGFGNNASATYSVVGAGSSNNANSQYGAILGGTQGTTRGIQGMQAYPACNAPISATLGVSQAGLIILGAQTTGNSYTVLSSDGGAQGTTNQVVLPNNSAYYFKGSVVAGVTGGGNTASWTFEGTIKRGANAGTTTLVGTPVINLISQDAGAGGASPYYITVTATPAYGCLTVTVLGQASTTIRWVCKIETTEMTF